MTTTTTTTENNTEPNFNFLDCFRVSVGRWNDILDKMGLVPHEDESEIIDFLDVLDKIKNIELLDNEKELVFFYLGIVYAMSHYTANNAD